MTEFISKNFVLILTVGLFLIFALIGFLVDSSNKNKELKNSNETKEDNNKEEQKEKEMEKIPIDPLAEEKKASKKKDKVENINLEEQIKDNSPKDNK